MLHFLVRTAKGEQVAQGAGPLTTWTSVLLEETRPVQ